MNTDLVLHWVGEGFYEVYYINGRLVAEFICMDDGYYTYWPIARQYGSISEGQLFDLFQNLLALNKEWDDIVQNDPRIV